MSLVTDIVYYSESESWLLLALTKIRCLVLTEAIITGVVCEVKVEISNKYVTINVEGVPKQVLTSIQVMVETSINDSQYEKLTYFEDNMVKIGLNLDTTKIPDPDGGRDIIQTWRA